MVRCTHTDVWQLWFEQTVYGLAMLLCSASRDHIFIAMATVHLPLRSTCIPDIFPEAASLEVKDALQCNGEKAQNYFKAFIQSQTCLLNIYMSRTWHGTLLMYLGKV